MSNERDNSGILFPNDKDGNERRPDYTGKATIDGVEFRLAGWKKMGRNGPFLSLAFTPPRDSDSKPPPNRGQRRRQKDLDDEIPF